MGSNSLKEYLKRYESNNEEERTNTKKKQKKKKTQPQATGLLVVDEDPVWQKPVDLAEENDDNSSDEEKPLIDEDIEVKRMRRLEQLRARRPYHGISEDGSGWVSLSSKHVNSSDMSPPGKTKIRNDIPSPEPGFNPLTFNREDADLSPPRQRSRRYDTPSPERGSQPARPEGKGSDISPPHKKKNQSFTPEQGTNPSTSNREDADLSPPCQPHFKGKDSDISPPRKQRTKSVTLSPARELRPSDSKIEDTDLSPPQQRPKEDNLHVSMELDISPPRKRRNDMGRQGLSDHSPRHSHNHSGNVVSRPSLAPDLSPLRKNQKELSVSASVKNQRTGLISGRDIREEIDKKKKDDWLRFKQMDPSVSGHGAEPVYRDKMKGERISKEEYLKSKQKVEEKPKEKEIEWGKGLAQKREAEARLKELELEKERPFARTRDDPDLDKMMKERLRWGDPMAHLVKKKYPEPVLPNLGENENMKESGFVVPQDIPDHSWLKRGLDAAPNRYSIRPGRHWDGVDRSNGFEKGIFKRMNEKQSTDKEAYLWSVSDM
ncbi:BUD13-like protein [Senna tora]|uniref:BUD13-like protein n=1 Tax=Senna tora TaxID=362788 RepID=A0A834TQS4_9FABA|nr:BUD13-like protein [Senna tora]